MNLKVLNKTEFGDCKLFDCENGILLLQFENGAHLDLEETIKFVSFGMEFINFEQRRIITDFIGRKNVFTEEAKNYVAHDPQFNGVKICDAFVIDSYISSILAGIYLRFFKPLTKTKVFSKLDDAIGWVLKQ